MIPSARRRTALPTCTLHLISDTLNHSTIPSIGMDSGYLHSTPLGLLILACYGLGDNSQQLSVHSETWKATASGVDPRQPDSFQVSSPIFLFHFSFGFQQNRCLDLCPSLWPPPTICGPYVQQHSHEHIPATISSLCSRDLRFRQFGMFPYFSLLCSTPTNGQIGSTVADSLASFAVSQTAILINWMTCVPLDPQGSNLAVIGTF